MQADRATGLVHGLNLSKPPSMNKIKPPKKKKIQTVRTKKHGGKKKIRKDFYEWMGRISTGSTSIFKPPLSASLIPALADNLYYYKLNAPEASRDVSFYRKKNKHLKKSVATFLEELKC